MIGRFPSEAFILMSHLSQNEGSDKFMTGSGDREPISIKGTRMGVMVGISEENSFAESLNLLQLKMAESPQLFRNAHISLDLGWRELHHEELIMLGDFLTQEKLRLQGIISSSLATRKLAEEAGIKVIIGRLGLSEHYSRTSKKEQEEKKAPTPFLSEETLMLRKTVRSGQKIEFHGNVVVLGDVNAGAEIIATGDIIVLGALRGVAHAGSGGKESSLVIAFSLEPTQLRIGSHRAITATNRPAKKNYPLSARVEQGKITLAPPVFH
jgi:septum site-determining protein MinC